MEKEHEFEQEAGYLLEYIDSALERLGEGKDGSGGEYDAFLHGQVYGIAMALRILFPGPGNWGEKAAFKIRPVMTEHKCREDEEA